MSEHATILETILKHRLIAIVRLGSEAGVVECVQALAEGGLKAIEITLNTPGALKAIAAARGAVDDSVMIGAGTVLSTADVRRAADAGAQFVVSPDTQPNVIAASGDLGMVSIPGALTPTEVAAAMRSGADLVKLFPANLFGPGYVKDLLAPLDKARLVPTGGVRLENLGEWFQAGAVAVALGSSLVDQKAVDAGDWAGIQERARGFVEAVKEV